MEYYEYLKGKTVALVGPANYMSNLKLGNKIDSFDVVVRINRGMEVMSSHPESLGKKADVLYNCLIDSLDNGGKIDVDFYKSKGIQWVSTIPGSKPTGECTSSKLHKMVNPKNVKLVQDNFNFHIMDHVSYGKLNKAINCRANTGFAAIFDILDQDVKEIFVCGFSFYLDDFIGGYKRGCSRDEQEFAKQCFVSKRHNQKNQWAYLKRMYNENDRIQCDPVLTQILSMKELSRDGITLSDFYPDQGEISEGRG